MSDFNRPLWPASEGDEDGDRTVVIPNPAGRRTGAEPVMAPPPRPEPPRAPARSPRAAPARERADAHEPPTPGLNPLADAAGPLLALIAVFRESNVADPLALRSRVVEQLRAFGADTQSSRATAETLEAASYCLCTAIDEAALRTPWGSRSDWRKLSLLRELHGDAWGGEKFFEILKGRMDNPAPNIALLELLYLCLALGFEGQYAMLDDGQRRLDRIREDLFELIGRQRGPVEQDLSPRWRNEAAARIPLEHPVPVWVAAAAAAALLLTAYLGFRFFLADSSAPAMDQLARFGREQPLPPPPPPAAAAALAPMPAPVAPQPPAPAPVAGELQTFLKSEIEQGLVRVIDSPTHITVRLSGVGLFAPGSDRLQSQFQPIVERIRAAIAAHQEDLPGDIIVVGHTDNVPVKRSMRFQDNYDLSRARAKSVALILKEDKTIKNAIETDGKGESEPVDGGDPASGNLTPEQRAANRRVEILIEQ